MSFSLEIGDHHITFLDLSLNFIQSTTDMTIKFEIFRKNAFTGISIENQSLHPQRHKHAVINYNINRLLCLPLSQAAKQAEIKYIQNIASRNGLHLNLHSMIRKRSLRLHLKDSASNNLPTTHVHQFENKMDKTSLFGEHLAQNGERSKEI